VVNPAIGRLHGEKPRQFITHLVEQVGHAVTALGDLEGIGAEPAGKIFVGHQQRAGADAAVDDIFAVIPGVVPPPRPLHLAVQAGAGVIPAILQVTGGMGVLQGKEGLELHAAALIIVAPEGLGEEIPIDPLHHPEGIRAAHAGDAHRITAGLGQGAEIGRIEVHPGRGILQPPQLDNTAEHGPLIALIHDIKTVRGLIDECDFDVARLIAGLIHGDSTRTEQRRRDGKGKQQKQAGHDRPQDSQHQTAHKDLLLT